MIFNKKTIASLLLAFLVLLALGTAHFIFLQNLNQLSRQKNDLEARQIILEELMERLAKTQTLFGSVPILVNTPLQKKEYLQTLKTHIQELRQILRTLKRGGSYHSTLHLNLPGTGSYHQNLRILPFSQNEIAPLASSLKEIERYRHDLDRFFGEKITLPFGGMARDQIRTLRADLAISTKKQSAFFRRTSENTNQLFYINRTQLLRASQQLARNESRFRYVTFAMSFLLLAVILIVSVLTIRRILRLNDALKERLYTDPLTGTLNRLALEEETFGKYSVVYMVDIDDFSGTNSLHGTEVGDQLLQAVSRRLNANCGQCKIHRFGGDVFALMAYDLRETDLSIKKRIAFVEDLIEGKAYKIASEKVHIGITIGVGVGRQAIAQAMLALDIAKVEKRPYKIYSRRNRFTRELQEQRHWKTIISSAIKEDRILPFVQPIVDRNGQISHHECLMRIAQPEGNSTRYLPPVFLETAKKVKLYPRLSRMIIQKSFEKFHKGGQFSINLSYLDIKEPGTRFFLEELIERHKAQGRVMFEILEHESLDDFDLVKNFLDHFRERGVQVAIDDFGSQYSNLMEIIRIWPDYLKIDGSLIRNITTNHNTYLAVRSITEFARDLDIKTIAEFVHDRDTFLTCKEIGVNYFQGYYFSPAIRTTDELELNADGSIQTGYDETLS